MTQVSQVNLLNEYATRRDAEAFAKLVDQYQRLIFSTCRRKLHNSQDVDDAVQETFLRLAHKAGELHSNIGGWLHRCAVNVSLDMNRRRTARQKYEHAAAAEQPAGVEDAQVELAELREHLDAALEKLDPEQRELIIQRFFVGRQQVEMAQEAGVSPSTMTRRIEGAIAAMRQHLQAMGAHSVGAAGAMVAVAAALEAEMASAMVPAALTANVMKIGLSGTGTAAGAGGAGAGGAGAGAGAGGTGGGAAAAAGAGAAAGTLVTAGMTKALVGLAATLVLAGGAIVAVVRPGSSTTSSRPPSAPQQAQLADVAVTVAALPEAQNPAPPRWQTTQPIAGDAVLEGVIRDADEKPVAGAIVTIGGGGPTERATTDAEGRYAIRTVRQAGEYRIGVEAAGFVALRPYASREAGVQLTPQSKARRDIVLQRGVTVNVTVRDVTGQGIEGVGIDSNRPGGDYRSQPAERVNTDELGRARVTLPVSSSAYLVSASKDDFEPKHALVTPASPDKPLDVEMILLPGLSVKGVAICNDGKPAVGWDVSARPDWWSSNYIPQQARVDASGNFTLGGVGPGKYELTVWRRSSDGSGTSVATASFTFPAKEPIRIDIPHPSPASMVTLAGRVKLIGGQADYVSVTAMSAHGKYYHSSVRMNPQRIVRPAPRPATGAARNATRPAAPPPAPPPANEGTFALEGIAPGVYRLQFESPTIESKTIENVRVPGDTLPLVELKVAGRPKLTGTVVDAETGKPVTHFAVRVNKTETIGDGPNYVQEPRWTQVSNPQGKFSLDVVGPGVYQAQVSLEGYAWTWSTPVRIEKSGGSGEVAIKVTRGGSLSGRVVDAAGKPVAGAKVIAFSMARAVGMRMEGRFEGDAGAAVTDVQGKFKLEHVAAGDEKLKVVSDSHAPRIIENLKVVEGKETTVDAIALSGGGVVEGVVYDDTGKPHEGVTLHFQDASGYGGSGDEEAGRLATATTDAQGRYRVGHLAIGEIIYVNVAERWNRQGVTRRVVRPVEGKVAKLDFGGTRPVKGRLLTASKEPVANQRVQLTVESAHLGAVMVNGRTDAQGSFNFVGPPPGRYTLYVMSAAERGEWTKVREIDVADEPVDLGDVANETGEVVITVTADDPDALKGVTYMSIASDKPEAMWQESVSRAAPEATSKEKWVAKNVPAGRFRVGASVMIAGLAERTLNISAPFERKPGESSTAVNLRIPRATATLTVTSNDPADSESDARAFVGVRSEDKSVQAYMSLKDAKPLKLPPGTYHLLDRSSLSRREDVEPIVLKDGESRSVTLPPRSSATAQTSPSAEVMVQVVYWTPDGVLVTGGERELIDAGGDPQQPRGYSGVGRLYAVAPGTYKTILKLPGKPPIEKEITTGAAPLADSHATGHNRWSPVHVVLD